MSYQPDPISHSTHLAQGFIIVSGSEGFDGRSRVKTIYYGSSGVFLDRSLRRYVAHNYSNSDGVVDSGS